MAPSDEIRGWVRLVAAVADDAVAGTAHAVHRAIGDSAFRWAGPLGRPAHAWYDRAVDRTYGLVRAALRGAGEVCAAAADRLPSASAPSPTAVRARSIAHGVVGEQFIARAPELDLDLTLRRDAREVPLDAASLRDAYPDAGGRIAVFVHGLVQSEAVWYAPPDRGVVLPEVASELGATPVLVRYGTGRAVGRNGADLAETLEAVVAGWPIPVSELTVVGHSMGGLLARAASLAAVERGHTWPARLTDVVYLGTPHLGSWLEKVANAGSWTLRHASPHSAPFGTLLDGRSRGIKDLRFGTLAEDGWGNADTTARSPSALLDIDGLLTGLVPDHPWLDGVTHHLVVGRLRPPERHPLNVAIGDALVRPGSAAGTGHRRRIGPGGQVAVVPVDASHTRLVRHPDVAALLRRVLARS